MAPTISRPLPHEDRGGQHRISYSAPAKTLFDSPWRFSCSAAMRSSSGGCEENRSGEEETGYRIKTVEKVFESYMSPGSVTEILHFFIAAYTEDQKVSEGGGAADETENIEVLEYSFTEALALIKSGEIKDAKTIMLLQYAQINLANLMK